MRSAALMLAILASTTPSPAQACPPPMVPHGQAPERQPGTDEAVYFDQLANMRIDFYPPPRRADETEVAFASRAAEFEAGMQAASRRASVRWAQAALENDRVRESAIWESATQILLVSVIASRRVGNLSEWQLRVLQVARGPQRPRSIIRIREVPTTSCGPYYPSFNDPSSNNRFVIFAPAGALTQDRLLAIESRGIPVPQDARTIALLNTPIR